jgi:hypothetical protein
MEWFFIQSEMRRCCEKVDTLSNAQNQIEAEANKLQQVLNSPSNPNETFARDIYNAINPIFEKKIISIQQSTIKELVERSK